MACRLPVDADGDYLTFDDVHEVYHLTKDCLLDAVKHEHKRRGIVEAECDTYKRTAAALGYDKQNLADALRRLKSGEGKFAGVSDDIRQWAHRVLLTGRP